MDSRSRNRALSILLLSIQDTGVQLIVYSGMFKSTSELDSERASTPMGSSGPYSELVYLVEMDYKGWIGLQVHFCV